MLSSDLVIMTWEGSRYLSIMLKMINNIRIIYNSLTHNDSGSR